MLKIENLDVSDYEIISTNLDDNNVGSRKAQIKIELASNIKIEGCSIESCTTNGINIENNVYNVQIYNSFFENLIAFFQKLLICIYFVDIII